MIGLYFTSVTYDQNKIDDAVSVVAEFIGTCPKGFYVASPASSKTSLAANSDVSLLAPLTDSTLEGAIFVAPTRYFCDSYSASLLAHVYNAIKPDQWLIVPFYSEASSQKTGFWNLNWLRAQLGEETQISKKRGYVLFRRRSSRIQPPISILTALLKNPTAFAEAYLTKRSLAANPDFLESCAEFLENRTYIPTSGIQKALLDMPDLDNGLESFLKYITYSVTGVAYKTEAIRRFLDRYLPRRQQVKTLDIGGGVGLVDMELLLTTPRVAHSTVCEPVVSTLPLTKQLFEAYGNALKNRYHHIVAAAQDLEFNQTIDVFHEFASLLYLPRDQLKPTLDQIWDCLSPGGIFIIHENIKRDVFKGKSYYDMVFTVDELEGYLQPYGSIEYFRSSDLQPMLRKDTKNLTVFRVIQKK